MGTLFSSKNSGKSKIAIIVIIILLLLIAIGSSEENDTNIVENTDIVNEENINLTDNNEETKDDVVNKEINNEQVEVSVNKEETNSKKENQIDLNKLRDEELAKIPAYSNSPYYIVNNNNPFFYDTDLVTTSYEEYSNLDNLRKMRCNNRLYRKRFNAN